MKWAVVWLPAALDELTRIWTNSTHKQAISRAADQIDLELSRDADKKGTLQRNKLVLIVPPLGVSFEVIPADRLVRVVQVAEETN
jgi:hypothetical protein